MANDDDDNTIHTRMKLHDNKWVRDLIKTEIVVNVNHTQKINLNKIHIKHDRVTCERGVLVYFWSRSDKYPLLLKFDAKI